MARQFRQFQHAGIRQVRYGIDARNARNGRAYAGINKDTAGLEHLAVHLELFESREARVPAYKIGLAGLIDALLPAGTHRTDDFVLALQNSRQVHANIAGVHAPALGIACIMSDLRARDQSLCRSAPGVNARSAERPELD